MRSGRVRDDRRMSMLYFFSSLLRSSHDRFNGRNSFWDERMIVFRSLSVPFGWLLFAFPLTFNEGSWSTALILFGLYLLFICCWKNWCEKIPGDKIKIPFFRKWESNRNFWHHTMNRKLAFSAINRCRRQHLFKSNYRSRWDHRSRRLENFSQDAIKLNSWTSRLRRLFWFN